MKIKKPKTTISNFEFSDPNEAGTVAFFDPTIKDDRGSFVVVRKEDAQLIQAAEDMRDALIKARDVLKCLDGHDDTDTKKPIKIIEKALRKAGCTINNYID